jgi:hypothetical protein
MIIHLQVAITENGVTSRHVFKLAEGSEKELDLTKFHDLKLKWDGDNFDKVWIWVTASLSDDESKSNYELDHQ